MANLIANTAAALNQNATRYKAGMNSVLRQDVVTLKHFKTVRVDYAYSAPNIAITGELFQAYQANFTPNNTETITSEKYVLQDVKIDIQWTATELNSFLASWDPSMSPLGKAALDYKFFTDYLVGNHVYPVARQAFEQKMIYTGVRVAPTTDVAGVAIAAIDGLEKIVNTAISASKMTGRIVAIGTINAGNVFDKIKLFCDSLPEVVKAVPRKVLCAPEIFDLYQYACYQKNQYVVNVKTEGYGRSMAIPFSNKTLVACPSMAGKQRLILDASAMEDNLVFGLRNDGGDIVPTIRWQEFDRTLKGLGETQMFVGVENFQTLWISDAEPPA